MHRAGGVMVINGLTLPALLIDLIQTDRWRVPANAKAEEWKRYLMHFVGFEGPYPQVRLFPVAEMEYKTGMLSHERYPIKLEPRLNDSFSRLWPERRSPIYRSQEKYRGGRSPSSAQES